MLGLCVYLGSAFVLVAILVWFLSFRDPRLTAKSPSFFEVVFSPLLARFGVGQTWRRSLSAGTLAGASDTGAATRHARRFRTIREAKEYLAGKITEEAEREGAPLSEVERKMIYFTETGWTLPDMMAVSAEFDRDYDQDEYEWKIGGLVGRFLARAKPQDEQEAWDEAVEKLSEGDHYLLVLIDAAPPQSGAGSSFSDRLRLFIPAPSRSGPRPPGDVGRLILMAFAVPFVFILLHFLLDRIFGADWHDRLTHFLR